MTIGGHHMTARTTTHLLYGGDTLLGDHCIARQWVVGAEAAFRWIPSRQPGDAGAEYRGTHGPG